MNSGYEKLNLFFERITTITFFQRVFNWKSLKSLSYQAYEEFKTLISISKNLSQDIIQLKNDISIHKNDN